MNKLILQIFALLLVASCSPKTDQPENKATPAKNQKAQLENGIRGKVKFLEEPENFSSIANTMKESKIPALSLAVINEGEVEWSETYQNADFLGEQPLDSTSVFQAASLSKPVTFLAALRMYAAGEIALDTNIQVYLKDYQLPQGKQTPENPVTFRNIFSHTSGISPGGYQGYARDLPMPSDISILRGEEGANTPAIKVVTPPNEVLRYSGGAYTLAELALQDYFAADFSGIMQKWILEPVGMEHSTFTQPFPVADSNKVAKGYTYAGKRVEGAWRNHPEQAAAGLWSNASDMAKILVEVYRAYQGKESVFSKADIEAILSHERDNHVYGFFVERSEDDIAITHYGGNAGYRTGMTISLTSGKGLVYLTNSDNGGLLGNTLLLSAAQVYGWKHFTQEKVHRSEVSSEVLRGLVGEYKWNKEVDLSIEFDESAKHISLFFPNGDEYKLTPIRGKGLDFIHSNSGVRVSFSKEKNYSSFTLYGQIAVKKH